MAIKITNEDLATLRPGGNGGASSNPLDEAGKVQVNPGSLTVIGQDEDQQKESDDFISPSKEESVTSTNISPSTIATNNSEQANENKPAQPSTMRTGIIEDNESSSSEESKKNLDPSVDKNLQSIIDGLVSNNKASQAEFKNLPEEHKKYVKGQVARRRRQAKKEEKERIDKAVEARKKKDEELIAKAEEAIEHNKKFSEGTLPAKEEEEYEDAEYNAPGNASTIKGLIRSAENYAKRNNAAKDAFKKKQIRVQKEKSSAKNAKGKIKVPSRSAKSFFTPLKKSEDVLRGQEYIDAIKEKYGNDTVIDDTFIEGMSDEAIKDIDDIVEENRVIPNIVEYAIDTYDADHPGEGRHQNIKKYFTDFVTMLYDENMKSDPDYVLNLYAKFKAWYDEMMVKERGKTTFLDSKMKSYMFGDAEIGLQVPYWTVSAIMYIESDIESEGDSPIYRNSPASLQRKMDSGDGTKEVVDATISQYINNYPRYKASGRQYDSASEKAKEDFAKAEEYVNAVEKAHDMFQGVSDSAQKNRVDAAIDYMKGDEILRFKPSTDSKPDKNGRYKDSNGNDFDYRADQLYNDALDAACDITNSNGEKVFDRRKQSDINLLYMYAVHILGIQPGKDKKFFGVDDVPTITTQEFVYAMNFLVQSSKSGNPLIFSADEFAKYRMDNRNLIAATAKGKKYRVQIRSVCDRPEFYEALGEKFNMDPKELMKYELSLWKLWISNRDPRIGICVQDNIRPMARCWIKACKKYAEDRGSSEWADAIDTGDNGYDCDSAEFVEEQIRAAENQTSYASQRISVDFGSEDSNPNAAETEAFAKNWKKRRKQYSNYYSVGSSISRLAVIPFTTGRIAFDVGLTAMGVVEHGQAAVVSNAFDRICHGDLIPEKEWFDSINSNDAAVDAFSVAMSLARLYPGAVNDFVNLGYDCTQSDLIKFTKELYGVIEQGMDGGMVSKKEIGKFASFTSSMAEKAQEACRSVMEAEGKLYSKSDFNRFLRSLIINGSRYGEGNSGIRLNRQQIGWALSSEKAGKAMSIMLTNPAARNALYSNGDFYNARMDPIRNSIDSFFGRHNMLRVLFASLPHGTAFISYAYSFMANSTPFFNTFQYLTAATYYQINKDFNEQGMVSDERLMNLQQKLEYVRGLGPAIYNDKIMQGLLECMALDAKMLATWGAKTLMFAAMAAAFNVTVPDDDRKRYPWEYIMDLPWGKVPVMQSWILDDTLYGTFYGGIVMAAYLKGDIDWDTFEQAWHNGWEKSGGAGQILGYGSLFEIADFINSEMSGKGSHTPGYYANKWAVSALGKTDNLMINRIIGTMFDSYWDYNPNRKADGSWRENYDSYNTSAECIWAQAAINSYGVVAASKIVQFFTKWDDIGRSNSAIRTASDPELDRLHEIHSFESFKKMLGEGDEDLNKEFRDFVSAAGYSADNLTNKSYEDFAKQVYAKKQIELIEQWAYEHSGSLLLMEDEEGNRVVYSQDELEAIQNSYKKDIRDLVSQKKDVYDMRDRGEISQYQCSSETASIEREIKDLNKKLGNVSYERSIIYSPDVYKVRRGENINESKYGGEGYYNYGDTYALSQWSLFYSPAATSEDGEFLDGTSGTYNTKVGTPGDSYMTNRYDQNTISPDFDIDNMKTSGSRNYIVNKDSEVYKALTDGYKEFQDEINELESQQNDSSDNSKYPSYWIYGGGYSGGGGGGYSSSYEPKIYSMGGSFSPARPATMYSKTPYSTNEKYLSPTVFTSGSRSSYSRRES